MHEALAKNSRKKIEMFGRQRGILAQSEKEHVLLAGKSSLQDAGSAAISLKQPLTVKNTDYQAVGARNQP